MIGDELPRWSPFEIEREAEACLGKSEKRTNGPTRIESLLQSAGDASIELLYGLQDHGASAVVCRRRSGTRRGGDRKYLVLVDQNLADTGPAGDYRIAIAEELGHIVLHQNLVASVKTVEDFVELNSRDDWQQVENEAVRFARAILVPRNQILPAVSGFYSALTDSLSFGDSHRFYAALCSQAAIYFGIPLDELQKRFIESGLDIKDRVTGSAAARADRLLEIEDLMNFSSKRVGKDKQLTFL